jgi:hypothetical protein
VELIPTDTALGHLEIGEVYDLYDFPRLFTVANRVGTEYLVLSVEEAPNCLSWLYLPISRERKTELTSGRTSLRTAFEEPESQVLLLRVSSDAPTTIEVLATVPEKLLPATGESLLSQPVIQNALTVSSEAKALAQSVWRAVARMTFYFPGYKPSAAPLRSLGEAFSAFQQMIDVFGAARTTKLQQRGPLPAEVLANTHLELAGTYASSFGVVLDARAQSDLFGDSVLRHAFDEFSELVSLSKRPEALAEVLKAIGIRGAVRYRAFLEALQDGRATAEMEWATPGNFGAGTAFLGREDIEAALVVLRRFEMNEAPTVLLDGQLVAFSLPRRTFEFFGGSPAVKFAGRVSDEVMVRGEFTVGASYRAMISAIEELNAVTGEARMKYVLRDLKEVG